MGMFFGDDTDNKVKETSNGFAEEIAGLNNSIAMAKICLIPFYLAFIILGAVAKILIGSSVALYEVIQNNRQSHSSNEVPETPEVPKLDSTLCEVCYQPEEDSDQ